MRLATLQGRHGLGSAAKEVAQFIVLAAKALGRTMPPVNSNAWPPRSAATPSAQSSSRNSKPAISMASAASVSVHRCCSAGFGRTPAVAP